MEEVVVSGILGAKWEEKRMLTSWVRMVRMKVKRGVISGSTAKEVSPTRPRVTLVMASRLTGRWREPLNFSLELVCGLSMVRCLSSRYSRTRSENEYMAQTLGAQYA